MSKIRRQQDARCKLTVHSSFWENAEQYGFLFCTSAAFRRDFSDMRMVQIALAEAVVFAPTVRRQSTPEHGQQSNNCLSSHVLPYLASKTTKV